VKYSGSSDLETQMWEYHCTHYKPGNMTANMETITIKRRSKCLSLQSTKKIGPAHNIMVVKEYHLYPDY